MKYSIAVWIVLMTGPLLWAGKFTLPVFPDTQAEVNTANDMFVDQMKWIVAHKQDLAIPCVLHVGDIIDWDTPDHRMWKNASAGFALLDAAEIP